MRWTIGRCSTTRRRTRWKRCNSFRREGFLNESSKPLGTIDDFLAYVRAFEQDDVCEAITSQRFQVAKVVVLDEDDSISWDQVCNADWDEHTFSVSKESWSRLPSNVADLLVEYFGSPTTAPTRASDLYVVSDDGDILVNLRHGVGFSLDDDKVVLYLVEMSNSERVVFGTHKLMVTLANPLASPQYA